MKIHGQSIHVPAKNRKATFQQTLWSRIIALLIIMVASRRRNIYFENNIQQSYCLWSMAFIAPKIKSLRAFQKAATEK
jgi:hypothetical protein